MGFEGLRNTTSDEQLRKQTLAREHLKEGTPHIVFNLIRTYIPEDRSRTMWVNAENNSQNEKAIEKIEKEGLELDSRHGDEDYTRHHMMTGRAEEGPNLISSYHMISSIDERAKYSKGYCNCVGAVFCGTSKTTGREVSFIIHIDSNYAEPKDDWRKEHAEMFEDALDSNIKKLLGESEGSTIDAVVYGGASWQPLKYKKVIDKLSGNISKGLGFEPVILTGPSGFYPEAKDETDLSEEVEAWADVYFDTQTRELYIVRGRIPDEDMDKPYYASSIPDKT